ncbi:hypothetical protein ACFL0Y_01155 [Patescibacteria group bacterium]
MTQEVLVPTDKQVIVSTSSQEAPTQEEVMEAMGRMERDMTERTGRSSGEKVRDVCTLLDSSSFFLHQSGRNTSR